MLHCTQGSVWQPVLSPRMTILPILTLLHLLFPHLLHYLQTHKQPSPWFLGLGSKGIILSSRDNSFILNLEGFPCNSVSKESACSAGDLGSIPGLGRCPGGANGNPLQYPCLENLLDRGAWWAAVHGVAKSRARLSD